MKNAFLLFISLSLWSNSTISLAQGIVFETGSWTDAVKKARKQKKLLFLHFDQPTCGTCSEVASVAFNSPIIKEKFMLNFISFRIDGSMGIGKELAEKVEAECIPSSVYLDTDENPLTRFCGTTSLDRAYLEKAEEAMTKNREQPMKALADAYARGDRSSGLLRAYIERRREAGLSTTDLLDTYVQQLPADSLRSAGLLRFIFEQAPVVGSKADSIFRRDYPRVDSLYKAVGWNKAVDLNNRITNNSLKKAIKEKNRELAFRTARFRQQTYQNDYKNGVAARDWVIMRYYRGTEDTLQYLTMASRYFDTQFMTAKVDSIQNLDNLDNQRRMRGTMPMSGTTMKPGQSSTSFMLNPNTQRYVGTLNNAAWEFYNMTRDTVYLKKALEWSKRSLEYREDGASMDTYAHLLYRLGRKPEALEWQQKAVRIEEERKSPMVSSLQKSLDKMKAGTL